jgi:undecaprenyl-diphosphatase
MTLIQAIIYGIVQGVAEFLPISSSAHLIALPKLLGWQDPGLAFDVALHLGTLVAIIVFFFFDWIKLIKDGFTKPKSQNGKLFWFIAIASIPGALFGKLFEKQAENAFRNLGLMGLMMITMGIILYIADKFSRKDNGMEAVGFKRSFIIGCSQALAIIPGVSRSGITMTTGLFTGLNKETAARFSFLLSTPLVFGAGLLKLKDLMEVPLGSAVNFGVGIVTSAIIGLLSIKFLLEYLKNKGFGIFVVYRIIVGALFIFVYFVK